MRTSANILAHSNVSGNKNLRIQEGLLGRELDPDFDFQRIDSENVGIIGIPTGSGDTVIRVPFRIADKDNNFDANGGQTLIIPDDWIIDITATTINLTTFTGGLIDGNSLEADTDYLLWAFINPFDSDNSKFKGFGLTKLPFTTGATVFFGGGLGALVTMTVSSPDGHAFNVGSRIVIRESIIAGTEYNQGIVTATTATTVTATLDTTYGAISESNIALSGGAKTYEIRQLTNFVPYMYSTTKELYPGSGTEYQFKYMGHIQIDADSDVKWVRFRGDPYSLLQTVTFSDATLGFSVNGAGSCARWLPFHAQKVKLHLETTFVSGAGSSSTMAATDAGVNDFTRTGDVTPNTLITRVDDEIFIRFYDLSIRGFITNVTQTARHETFIEGYTREIHF